ncbi:MAG TPA: type II toxin-antitoxin system VapC family toxin [Acidimicrobiales bacterium]|nr:type II toxin-antitoxin system VapC family toxin [Acidimicrobiales bacterium]
MKFWDSSAVVPLVVEETATKIIVDIFSADAVMLVCWGTEIECVSAVCRLERENALTRTQATSALDRLHDLGAAWHEVQAVEAVRRIARRLLRTHALRASDSLQLAAALVASEGDAGSLDFLSLDDRLRDAAEREGLAVVDITGGSVS